MHLALEEVLEETGDLITKYLAQNPSLMAMKKN
jgi:hypothetical protein